MDIIQQALAKRQQLASQIARIDAFLETARDLQQEFSEGPAGEASPTKAPAKASRKRGGVGAETVEAAVAIIRERGEPMSTRELLPLVQARGIPVGGNDAIATLSARISNKGVLHLTRGKWWPTGDDFQDLTTNEKEAAGQPAKEEPTASWFDQNKGGHDAALA